MTVVVCGLDDVALRVVEQLHAAGEQVVVVDDEFDLRHGRVLESLDVPLRVGSPRRRQVLAAAGLDAAEAVICADSNDLVNLEVALLVHEQWPAVRLVVALTNVAVGRAIVGVVPNVTVLDVPSLAAPSFIEAAIGARTHAIDLDGVAFTVRQRVATTAGTIREAYGDLAPIAVVRHAGPDDEVVVCPGRDQPLEPGDVVSLLGPTTIGTDRTSPAVPSGQGVAAARDSLMEHTATSSADTPGKPTSARRSARWRRWFDWPRLLWEGSDRPLRLALLAIVLVEVISVIILMTSYRESGRGMGAIDAVYFTTETITGVGFGDFSFSTQVPWLRLWAIALMLVGAATVTLVYAFLTNVLISRRIAESQGRRALTGMRDHVVVIGVGAVGSSVVAGVRTAGARGAGTDVVVLDADENNRFLGRIRDDRIPVVIGDATLESVLRTANVPAARAVAVVTSNDLTNIETSLAIRDLAPDVPVVVRVFDRQLAATISHAFGFGLIRSTSALAAPWFVGAALGLQVLNTFYVQRQPFLVARLDIDTGGQLVGAAMAELGARIRVVAIRRSGSVALEFPPRRDTRFDAGDAAFVVGPYEELLAVLRRNRVRSPS